MQTWSPRGTIDQWADFGLDAHCLSVLRLHWCVNVISLKHMQPTLQIKALVKTSTSKFNLSTDLDWTDSVLTRSL